MFHCNIDDQTELRMIVPEDAERLDALIEGSREHIREWSAWLKIDRSIENTREFIGRNLANYNENKGFAVAIWHRGEMAGQIEYNYFDWENRKTELGLWLGETFQGKGLATRSCRVLIGHAFDQLNLEGVEMHCGVDNLKSRRIAEKLGFREERIDRRAQWLHTRFVEMVVYAIAAGEWKTLPSEIAGS